MRLVAGIAALCVSAAIASTQPVQAQQVITLNGAVQFNDDHAFTKALVKFEELVAVMKTLGQYWVDIVELPPETQGDGHGR